MFIQQFSRFRAKTTEQDDDDDYDDDEAYVFILSLH